MSRPESIYPVSGWSLGPPNVPDPLACVPFEVSVPYWDEPSQSGAERIIQIGVMYDDSVQGTGGVCSELERELNNIWMGVINQWYTVLPSSEDVGLSALITPNDNIFITPPSLLAEIKILQQPDKFDEWYQNTKFGKYGWIAQTTGFGNDCNGNLQWWNFANQTFYWRGTASGYRIFLQPKDSLAIVNFYKYIDPPPLRFTGWLGINGTFDSTGVHYN